MEIELGGEPNEWAAAVGFWLLQAYSGVYQFNPEGRWGKGKKYKKIVKYPFWEEEAEDNNLCSL